MDGIIGPIGLMDGVIGLIGGGDMADGGGDMEDIGGEVVVEVVGGIDMVDGGIVGAIMGDCAAERARNVRKREKIIIRCERAMIMDDSLRMFCFSFKKKKERNERNLEQSAHTKVVFEEVCILQVL